MGTEESIISLSTINASAPSPSASLLSRFNVAALRRDFERLSVDDLTALASFPIEPHELIGRVVAVTHCLLLSLTPEHTTLELRAPPWPLLRLQLLENTSKIWRKLRKRAWQLETGVKSLSPVQICFGCKELVPFILPSKQGNPGETWQLYQLAQVSTIAASLGAWVVFCLCSSVSSSLSINSRSEVPSAGNTTQPFPSLKSGIMKSATCIPLKLVPIASQNPFLRSSRRIGLKVGGRFMLFRTRFPSNVRPDVKSVKSLGEWSVYCLDINRIGRQQPKGSGFKQKLDASPLNGSWWNPPHKIEAQLSKTLHSFAICQMVRYAQQSLLLQLGFHENLFERPSMNIPYVKTPWVAPPVFTLKFNLVVMDSKQRLFLLGIGNALITMETTVEDLRSQITPPIVSRLLSTIEKHNGFRFLYRGSFLAVSQEKHLPAITVLPFALLVVSNSYLGKGCQAGGCASQLCRHHNDVSQALVNAGVPENLQHIQSLKVGSSIASCPSVTQVLPMRQPFVSTTTTCSSIPQQVTTASVIVEFFTHWQAFMYCHQLQDSSVLFQLPQRSPKNQMKSPHKSPNHRLNNDNEDVRDESIVYGPHPQPLPRKKFNNKREWLLPLYAVAKVTSPTSAVLRTQFRQDVEHALDLPCRLVLAEESNVIHVTRINQVTTHRNAFGLPIAEINITFVRDSSCPVESLLTFKSAYTWLIKARSKHKSREEPREPIEWMIDLYRFVQHPAYDFQSPERQSFNNFRVTLHWDVAERVIEAAFWSKSVDWAPSVSSTDLYTTVLRQIFDSLCRSHPPAFGVDSVKFSKLLYEAQIQPSLLSIGDAAFLFASNLTPGFTYEMDFDGFVRAIEWLSQQFYSDSSKNAKTSPSKIQPGIQHAMVKWQLSRSNVRGRLLAPLRRFCYEILVHLPSLTSTWHEIMDVWRRERKQQYLQEYALKYCAATRLRATWLGFIAWRMFLQRRQRMKEERLAATKLQSFARERKHFMEYQRVRQKIIRTQLRVHARAELRHLRAERAAFIERMGLRMVKWMRHHLWLLREWKRLNAEMVARRDRIREKRLRRLGVAVFPLEAWCVRFSLYCAKLAPLTEELEPLDCGDGMGNNTTAAQQDESSEMYDLEVVESAHSWGQVFSVSLNQIKRFVVEETERLSLQQERGLTTLIRPPTQMPISKLSSSPPKVSKCPLGRKQMKASVARDSVVHPMLKPNVMLLALARRLVVVKDTKCSPVGLRCYNDPTDTSLGKRIFKGALRSESAQPNERGEILVQRHIVRVLKWTDTFKLHIYTPATSSKRRYDLDASFILAVLQFSCFQSMRLAVPNEEQDGIVADNEDLERDSQFIPHKIHRVLNGPHKALALAHVLSYVLKYGVSEPTYALMPHVVAERERKHQERESEKRNAQLIRERQLITMVQARLHLHIAKKTRQQLALSSYSKQFDRATGQFVYARQYQSGARVVLGERKPFILFDKDVPLPPDMWQLVSAPDTNLCFFNPLRGDYSRYNDILAANMIQRWFRGKMWNGINNWTLRDLAHALRYHSSVQKPKNMTDPSDLENVKRYGLQLHVLEHQYKAAYSAYEAALDLSPHDPQTLVCLAVLLVISCRYPAAKSWNRAMSLLQQARELVGDEIVNILREVEQNTFRWALFLEPKNPHTIANYAAYLQCIHLDIDKAELLYRRALDLDQENDLFVTNFQRLLSERAPGGLYAFAGPGKIALARSLEVRRCGSESQWREMEDPAAQPPMLRRFFQDLHTGKCTWELPSEYKSTILSVEEKNTLTPVAQT